MVTMLLEMVADGTKLSQTSTGKLWRVMVTMLLEMVADEVITRVSREAMTCNGDDVIGNGCRRYKAITNVDREAMTCHVWRRDWKWLQTNYHKREQGSYDV